MKACKYAAALLLTGLFAPAMAHEYQDAISKVLPGFQILESSDIQLEKANMDQHVYEQVKDRPGLAVGNFNADNLPDFAALIRGTIKKRNAFGDDYYDGYLIVCYGLAAGGFDCTTMNPSPREFHLPFGFYLERVAPGRHLCHVLRNLDTRKQESRYDERQEVNITTQTDSIGYFRALGSGDVMYVRQRKTAYTVCVLSD